VNRREFLGLTLLSQCHLDKGKDVPLILPFVVPPIQSFDFFISPTAPDSNNNGPGTQSNPWSINALNTNRAIYGGKRVGLMDGVYGVFAQANSTIIEGAAGGYCTFNIQGGTAQNPTVIASVNPRKAILDAHITPGQRGGGYCGDPSLNTSASFGSTGGGPYLLGNSNADARGVTVFGNLIYDGLVITGSCGGILNVGTGSSTGYVVRNCEIFDCIGDANYDYALVKNIQATGALVQNNLLHDQVWNGQPAANNPPVNVAAIFAFNCDQNTYELNTIYHCPTGIHDKNGWNLAPGLEGNNNQTIRYNYIEMTAPATPTGTRTGHALQDCVGGKVGSTTTAYNNIFVVSGLSASLPAGNDLTGNPATPITQSWAFFNNTLYISSNPFNGFSNYRQNGSISSPAAALTYYNNIFVSTVGSLTTGVGQYIYDVCEGTGCFATVDFNYYVAPGAGLNAGIIAQTRLNTSPSGPPTRNSTLAQCQSIFGTETHSQATATSSGIFTNPGVALTPTGYQLAPGSPCANFGRIGGSGSTLCDAGAWGGANAPARVGASFTAGN